MRKVLFFSTISLLLFLGCSDKDKGMENEYTPVTLGNIPSNGLVLTSDVGSSVSFTVTASESWSVTKSSSDTWFSVNPMNGTAGTTTVTLLVLEENPHPDDRTANISIGNKTITITQKRAGALILSPYKEEISADGEILEVTITHNLDYSIFIAVDYRDWIKQIGSKSMTTETLKFQIEPITDEDLWTGRYGEIIIKDNESELSDTIKIYQNQKDRLVIYPATNSTKFIDYQGGTFDIVLRSNIDYRSEIIDPEENYWIEFVDNPEGKSSYRQDTYTLRVGDYTGVDYNRIAKVVFKNDAGTVTDTLYVIQSYKDAVFTTESEYNIDYHTFNFNVVLNVNTEEVVYEVEYDQNSSGWLKTEDIPESKTALYEKVLKFTAFQNFSSLPRTATVNFIVPSTSESQSIIVRQGPGADLEPFIYGERALHAQRGYRQPSSDRWAGTETVLVSWRSFPGESMEFDIYRKSGSSGEVKLNIDPISNSTNFLDSPDLTVENTYILKVAGTNTEIGRYNLTLAEVAEPWRTIPLLSLESPDGGLHEYSVQDICIGDLTGNGQYDLILRRECNSVDVAESVPCVGEAFIEAYTLEGVFLWRVGLGPNIVQGEHTVPFLVYDFDGDGSAELVIRTSELTTFGNGYQFPGQNYVTSNNVRALGAPEYLSVIDGRTGKLITYTDYIPLRPEEEWTDFWGDNWGNRSSRFLMGVAYLDGSNPSIVMCRGYYKGTVIEAWDYRGGQLSNRWKFEASSYTGVNPTFEGQGNHQIFCADVDDDGRDDIIYGSMTVSSYGTPIYSYGYGHGDAMSVGKFIKGSSGLQIWSCFESGATGASFRDGRGYEYFNIPGEGDIGRCMLANFDPNHNGYLMWAYMDNGAYYDTYGNLMGYLADITDNWTRYMSIAVWWSGSLNRQLSWRTTIDEYTGTGINRLNTLSVLGNTTHSNKDMPLFYGDIYGDWREEMIFAKSDQTAVIVYSTPHETNYRIPYLMSDRTYRMSAINQNVGYNQGTNTGFYMGPDMFD